MTQKLDNNFVDGKWAGRFLLGDKVIFTSDCFGRELPPREATVTHCFGWGDSGCYVYIVTFYDKYGRNVGFAHAQEYELTDAVECKSGE